MKMASDDRDLRQLLAEMAAGMPSGALVSLPVEWIREHLESPEQKATSSFEADLTVKEVGDRMDRSPSTVRGWCSAGKLPKAYRFNGREWRVAVDALERFQERQRKSDGEEHKGRFRRKKAPKNLGEWQEE